VHPPGPLERNGDTFSAIAPTPQDRSAERVESFYRKYNDEVLSFGSPPAKYVRRAMGL